MAAQPRDLEPVLAKLRRRYPVLTLTGPRQSGKTTLCRRVFPKKPYASLETPDVREEALGDARGFLGKFPEGAVLDEVQRAPELLSYIQTLVDERKQPGEWVLTGSQHFGLLESVSQSLAGRTAVLHLLPLSLGELRRFPDAPEELFEVLFSGGYPAIHDRGLEPTDFLADYVQTYVERDVRQVRQVGDLLAFQGFLRQCAGRSGTLATLPGLAADAGLSHPTARAWLSVLETSFLAFRLPPFFRNLRKRLIKTPKLYFYDSGLLCYLLGIREPLQIRDHPLRGAIFETWVVSEVMKAFHHAHLQPSASFYRDRTGQEVDLVIEHAARLLAVEIKSGLTASTDFLRGLHAFQAVIADTRGARLEGMVVYGGDGRQTREGMPIVPWSQIDRIDWTR